MSTRSRIGIIRQQPEDAPDGLAVVESIYCHFDGYPEGVGQTLLDHWTTEAKVNRLMRLGDLSSLGKVPGRKHDFDQHSPRTLGDDYEKLLAESPLGKGWCCAYGRDRGEKDCGSRMHSIKDWPDYGQEAEYVFDPREGKWWVSSPGQNPVGWNTVAAWHGFISIPDAIRIEKEEQERWEREKEGVA